MIPLKPPYQMFLVLGERQKPADLAGRQGCKVTHRGRLCPCGNDLALALLPPPPGAPPVPPPRKRVRRIFPCSLSFSWAQTPSPGLWHHCTRVPLTLFNPVPWIKCCFTVTVPHRNLGSPSRGSITAPACVNMDLPVAVFPYIPSSPQLSNTGVTRAR